MDLKKLERETGLTFHPELDRSTAGDLCKQDGCNLHAGASGENNLHKEVHQGEGRRIGSSRLQARQQPATGTSGLLVVSVGVEQESFGMIGTRKRKGQESASRKVSVESTV